jgi:hypothetical protein
MGTGIAVTGIADLSATAKLRLYPNPTANSATLALTLAKDAAITISITDISGREVMPAIDKKLQSGENLIELNTASLSDGMYFLKITDGSSATNVKMVIMH